MKYQTRVSRGGITYDRCRAIIKTCTCNQLSSWISESLMTEPVTPSGLLLQATQHSVPLSTSGLPTHARTQVLKLEQSQSAPWAYQPIASPPISGYNLLNGIPLSMYPPQDGPPQPSIAAISFDFPPLPNILAQNDPAFPHYSIPVSEPGQVSIVSNIFGTGENNPGLALTDFGMLTDAAHLFQSATGAAPVDTKHCPPDQSIILTQAHPQLHPAPYLAVQFNQFPPQ